MTSKARARRMFMLLSCAAAIIWLAGNWACTGLAWRSAHQSLTKRRIRYRDATRKFTERGAGQEDCESR